MFILKQSEERFCAKLEGILEIVSTWQYHQKQNFEQKRLLLCNLL